jgi:putative N6-adenine-specific DNA methylase
MKGQAAATDTPLRFHGFDRDAGAVRMSTANAARAGITGITRFAQGDVTDLEPPEGPPGLVIVNPPYGARIGNRKLLFALHARLGNVLKERFRGWRVGLVTSDAGLAKATGLPFAPPGPPVPHGGLKVRLHRTGPLP